MTKYELLKLAERQRIDEVSSYQFNIDNFVLAIKHIEQSGDSEMEDFKQMLLARLKTERHEQKKSQIMLDVVTQQLKEFE